MTKSKVTVIKGKRIALKQTSEILIRQVQEMLSSVGIGSYITTNKPTYIEHANGTYKSKQSYDLNIISSYKTIFMNDIGFLQKYKKFTGHGIKTGRT